MSYDSVAHFVKLGGTVAFFTLFLGVLLYTFWPGNQERFKRAAHRPLEDESPIAEEASE
jgi:cytochrome c oxidase cbb3-type subunit 4